MELFVKICLKIKKDIFESLLKLFAKKDVAHHFPRRTIRYENPLLSGKVNRQHNNNRIFLHLLIFPYFSIKFIFQ